MQFTHVFFHDVVDRFKFFLHALYVLHRSGVLELFLLVFDRPVKFDEIVVAGDALQSGLEVGDPQYDFCLVEEGSDDGVDEPIGKFEGIGLVDDDCENNIVVYFVEDAIGGVFNLFEGSLFMLVIRGHLSVMLLDLMPDLKQLLIRISF